MEFLHGQHSLSTVEWILRAAISFFILLITAKIMGSRAISQLRLLDFVIALMLGNIIAHPLSDQTIGLKGSVISTLVIAILYIGGVFLSLKWTAFRKLTDSAPIPLIKNGEILYKGLRKARISIDFLLAELRKEKVADIKKVALALWESDGKLSIFLDPQHEAITPATYQIKTDPFDLPKTIIKEGKIDFQVLNQVNKEKEWLINTIKDQYKTDINEVLLTTIDNKNKLTVFLYK
ncbi:DUF421 domain-containing protein [Neobacillus sp. OS1-2]|uniref:DUF421 domain-containing protein n=1 Tax=Neobacillus sp. OS1-2 TaxID=3070680 RepID=UPI0027DED968|nr:DUF421 domain-containing protein [Neobacillus sp. OS1-2]WML40994.1 DUF421 domain-containing protein [Neobacillus sp. OS1-2]